MEQRRCCINPPELQEKLCEEGIDIEQKGSDSLIFGKNERGEKRITGVMYTDSEKTVRGPRVFFPLLFFFGTERFLSILTAAKRLREFLN